MRFTIITHVLHYKKGHSYFAYAPYVREMNIWAKYVDELVIVAPVSLEKKSSIDEQYKHQKITLVTIDSFNILSLKNTWKTLFKIPKISRALFKAMQVTDHIHLRCPGNIGLIAAFIQIAFPQKIKTVKYAGNWDPNAKQPWSYKLQKMILSNSIITKNCQVLVYGKWPLQSKNIKSFFTASYSKEKYTVITPRVFEKKIQFLFVGTLSAGKRPMLAVKVIEELIKKGHEVKLDLYGDGVLRGKLKNYILQNKLESHVFLHGNRNAKTIEEAYKKAHFLILPSKSEGWPKVIAEAMFWKCVPIATSISCVPWMLDYGKRGCLIQPNLQQAVTEIELYWETPSNHREQAEAAAIWSRKYTLNLFETEIKKLL